MGDSSSSSSSQQQPSTFLLLLLLHTYHVIHTSLCGEGTRPTSKETTMRGRRTVGGPFSNRHLSLPGCRKTNNDRAAALLSNKVRCNRCGTTARLTTLRCLLVVLSIILLYVLLRYSVHPITNNPSDICMWIIGGKRNLKRSCRARTSTTTQVIYYCCIILLSCIYNTSTTAV